MCWRHFQFSSVQFSCSVVSNSSQPHESQHARPPCPSPTPGVHSDSCPSSQWCHPSISSSVVPFSSCSQSVPASESFPMSQLFAWGGQSTGVSTVASFPPKNTQGWSPSEWTGWISLQSRGCLISPKIIKSREVCLILISVFNPLSHDFPPVTTHLFLFFFWGPIMEKAMAPHSSTLAWKISWMEEPGGLWSMGSRRVGHN